MAMGQPNFKVALLSVNFDSSYTNVLHFTSRSQQQSYFNLPARFSNAPLANFNATSLLETSVNFNANPTDNLNTLCMQNYCIIQDLSGSEISYFFYFVRRARQLSGYNIQLDLELDIFQTYYIEAQFTDCLIDRTHLDRFVEINSTQVAFNDKTPNADPDGALMFLGEPIEASGKYITQRGKVTPWVSNNNDVNTWLATNVKAWAYLYVDINGVKENYRDEFSARETASMANFYYRSGTTAGSSSRVDVPYGIFCAPIMLSNTYNVQHSDGSGESITYSNISSTLLDDLAAHIAPYVYAYKISAMPPCRVGRGTMTISGNNMQWLELALSNPSCAEMHPNLDGTTASTDCVLLLRNMNIADTTVSSPTKIDINTVFNKSAIIGANKSPAFNPKMYSPQYTEFYVTDGQNNKYSFDIQKSGYLWSRYNDTQSTFNGCPFGIAETYVADATKIYITLNPDLDTSVDLGLYDALGYYTAESASAYVGLMAQQDNAYPYSTDQLNAYLAQNKNYYLQLQSTINLARLNMGASIVSGLIGTATDAGAGAVAAGSAETLAARNASIARTGIGAVGGLANTTLRAITSNAAIENQQAQADWTLDNMRAAPDSLSSGNPFLTLMLNNFAYTWELWELTEPEKERVNDYMCQFGYAYGRVGNIKDFDHSRKYYNYIRAEVQEVSSTAYALSMAVHDRFQQAFAEGVRFWHWDGSSDGITYDYDLENYEVSLES